LPAKIAASGNLKTSYMFKLISARIFFRAVALLAGRMPALPAIAGKMPALPAIEDFTQHLV